jgi:hypothetical protein
MSRSSLYLSLAAIGALLPWLFFLQFFRVEGLAGDFVGALFVNGAAGGFTTDLLPARARGAGPAAREVSREVSRLTPGRHGVSFAIVMMLVPAIRSAVRVRRGPCVRREEPMG